MSFKHFSKPRFSQDPGYLKGGDYYRQKISSDNWDYDAVVRAGELNTLLAEICYTCQKPFGDHNGVECPGRKEGR